MSDQSLQRYEPGDILVDTMPAQPASMFGNSPELVIANATNAANALKSVLKQQGLISNIQGKEYPRCEAWTLLGTMVGVFPVLCWSKPIEGGWEARVEARMRDGTVVGAAEAQCAKSERTWANRDDYAIRSMAQTRATAKALRMPLGFVMTLAGYEPTPAEEMAHGEPQQPAGRVQTQKPAHTPYLPSKTPAIGVKQQAGAHGQAPAPLSTPAIPTSGAKGEAKGVASPTFDAKQCKARFLQIIAEKQWMLYAWSYAVSQGWMLDTERLEDAPPEKFPKTAADMAKIEAIIKRAIGDAAAHGGITQEEQEAYDAAHLPDEIKNQSDHEWWMDLELHFGPQKGTKLIDLDRNKLFGWAKNYEPKPFKGKIGDADAKLRKALDEALSWLEENNTNPKDDDIPF